MDDNKSSNKKVKKVASKRSRRLRFFIISCVLVVIAAFVGNFAGNWIVNMYLDKGDFSANENNLRESVTMITQWQRQDVSTLTPMQAYLVAEQNLKEIEKYTMNVTGSINAGIVQGIHSYNYRFYDEYYSEYISESSLVKVAKAYKYDATLTENSVVMYVGENTSPTTANWGEPTYATYEEYKGLSGVYPGEYLDYIVSRYTIKEEECTPLVLNEKGNYNFTLSLNERSAVNYVKKMQFIAGTQATKFDDIKLYVEIDAQGRFVSINVKEKYIALGMNATSDIIQSFDYVTDIIRK